MTFIEFFGSMIMVNYPDFSVIGSVIHSVYSVGLTLINIEVVLCRIQIVFAFVLVRCTSKKIVEEMEVSLSLLLVHHSGLWIINHVVTFSRR